MDHAFEDALEPTCIGMRDRAARWRGTSDWPEESLTLCGEAGLFAGLSLSNASPERFRRPFGSRVWSPSQQVECLVRLAESDLLTTFVITQHLGAIKHLLRSDAIRNATTDSRTDAEPVLMDLLAGNRFGSVGISHLTTSRRHLGHPAVTAMRVSGGFQLSGTVPWVTGAAHIDQVVIGAVVAADQTELLALLSPNTLGVTSGPGTEMIAMSASCTDAVELADVFVPDSHILSGPRADVLSGGGQPQAKSGGTGGIQTSALALGLSQASLNYLREQSQQRANLVAIVNQFDREHQSLHEQLMAAADGESTVDVATIRSTANRLVQRTTSAAMTAAKGAGLKVDHPVARWCQQSFFFLVWSCPQPVAEAHLCDMAGLA
ncbi:acyl-CoA dehydrogenase [Roseiconus nitratireducens]|uniref:Acyl-CoA dehydrogenase n=1 Tax=Roseiconus nitratireducens TaxID=2605748 RepID=A0A5M6DFA3_9BACT|nr:acyl-CoA dehydrogenase family protein [Roseiconus nitratireducens]KAA5546227.1 acyl-CoA dehydrogenase [Roseiconus nitratireducens]